MILIFLLKVLSRLPFWFLYLFADFLYFIAYRVIGYRKAVVYENIKGSFPEKSEEEIQKIMKDFYKNLSQVLVELLKNISISKEEVKKRVKVINGELLENYLKSGTPVLVMAGHQANWEWVYIASCVYYEQFGMEAVYQPLNNKQMDKFARENRTRFGGKLISMKEIIRHAIKNKKVVRAIGLIADQSPGKDGIKHWVNFLHRDTAFFTGTQSIAQLTQHPVIFSGLKRVRKGYYELKFEKIAEPPYQKGTNEVIEIFAQKLEKQIQDAPSDWLWSHRRWKLSR
jgi:KDO2-lipid IV(A) lauroyltransferase